MSRQISYAQAINEATMVAMERDSRMLCFGLGMDDPKRIFGTTEGLVEAFGRERVFDMPTSEAGMTGIAIGASLDGARCLMTHQRLDFFLLALDQLVNNAAKWQYMFGGQSSPVRLVLSVGLLLRAALQRRSRPRKTKRNERLRHHPRVDILVRGVVLFCLPKKEPKKCPEIDAGRFRRVPNGLISFILHYFLFLVFYNT